MAQAGDTASSLEKAVRFGKTGQCSLVVRENCQDMHCASEGNKSQPGYVFWLKLLSAILTGRCQEYD